MKKRSTGLARIRLSDSIRRHASDFSNPLYPPVPRPVALIWCLNLEILTMQTIQPSRPFSNRCWGLALTLALLVLPAAAQETPDARFTSDTRVTAVGVVVGASLVTGAVVPTLKAEDLVLREGESSPPVLSIVPVGTAEKAEPWRVVLYVDRNLASPVQLAAAALSLGEQVKPLLALGSFEIWAADSVAEPLLSPTRDEEVVSTALARFMLEVEPEDEITTLRRQVLEALAGNSKEKGANEMPGVQMVEGAVEEELAIVERAQDTLLNWVAEEPGGSPRLLLLVGSGYDLDPAAFYRQRAGASAQGLNGPPMAAGAQRFAETVAAYGWVVCPLLYTEATAGPSSTSKQFQQFRNTGLFGNQQQAVPVVGGTVQLNSRGRREKPEPPWLLAPHVPLGLLAAESGGRTVEKVTELPALLADLASRHYVTFQVDRALDGRLRPLTLGANKTGMRLNAPKWVRSSTPEAVAEARVRRIVTGEPELGELALSARKRTSGADGKISVSLRLDLGASAQAEPSSLESTLRLTVASGIEGGPARFTHHLLVGQKLSGALWSHELPLDLTGDEEWLVLVVEDLATGAWGARDLSP